MASDLAGVTLSAGVIGPKSEQICIMGDTSTARDTMKVSPSPPPPCSGGIEWVIMMK